MNAVASRMAGQRVLVTGGARGLGEAFVRALVDAGARVALGDVLHERGARLAGELGAHYLPMDMADPQAIGFSSAAYADGSGVGVLAIDGIAPDKANFSSQRYPLLRDLTLVTRDKTRAEVAEFVRYCADAGKGQRIIASMGLVPISGGKP